jgi:hypothetical protein
MLTKAVMYFGIAARATVLDLRFNDYLFHALHIHDPIWRLAALIMHNKLILVRNAGAREIIELSALAPHHPPHADAKWTA